MPDLNLGPPQHTSPAKSILLAVVALAVVAFAIFYFNPRKTAETTITNVSLYAAHSTSTAQSGGTFGVIGQAPETSDDLYVVVTLHIENKLRLPIFLNGVTATYTTPQDAIQQERAVSLADQKRLEETFPDIAKLMPEPLSAQAGIDPGSTAEGQLLFHFSGFTEATWNQRKSASLNIDLQHQNSLQITLPQETSRRQLTETPSS